MLNITIYCDIFKNEIWKAWREAERIELRGPRHRHFRNFITMRLDYKILGLKGNLIVK